MESWRITDPPKPETPKVDEAGNGAETPTPLKTEIVPTPPVAPPEEAFVCDLHDPPQVFKSKQGLRLHQTRAHGTKPVTEGRSRKQKEKAATPPPILSEKPDPMFDSAKTLGQVAPGGHVPTQHFERVHAWLEEGRKLHGLLGG